MRGPQKRSQTGAPPVDPTNLTLDQAGERLERVHLAGRNLAAKPRVEYLADLRDAIAS
jgi:hypothetical protein